MLEESHTIWYTITMFSEVIMKEIMKKLLLCGCICSLFILGGCQSSEEKPEEEEIQLVSNQVYDAPNNPTQEQIKVYNELSAALNQTSDEKIAELVAVNFAYDFFSLYNKDGKEDIGGLTFLPEDERDDFKSYALYRYYNNYATVVSQYSKDDLPNVILHEVSKIEASQLLYNQLTYDGYIVSLTLKYADSKLPAGGLKTTLSVQVINLDGVYRVIAVED